MKTLALATAAIGLAFTASPAFAGPEDVPTMSFSTDGIDLNTAEGQRILSQRIDHAAREVCQVDAIRTGTRIRSARARDCVKKARASAMRQVAIITENQRRGG